MRQPHQSRRIASGRWAVFGALAILMGCSSTDNGSVDQRPAPPTCAEQRKEGVTLTDRQWYSGCLSDGEETLPVKFFCGDGRFLYAAPGSWGFGGEPVRVSPTGRIDDDPAYHAAVAECQAKAEDSP